MATSEFQHTFVHAFANWSFSPDQLSAYQRLLAERKPYLICVTPRSGSTYLCDLLRRARSAGMPEERLDLARDWSLEPERKPMPGRSKVTKIGDARNLEWARQFVADDENRAYLRQFGIPAGRHSMPAGDPSAVARVT